MRSMYAPMAMVRTGPAYTMTDGPGWMVMVGVSVPIWRSKLSAGWPRPRRWSRWRAPTSPRCAGWSRATRSPRASRWWARASATSPCATRCCLARGGRSNPRWRATRAGSSLVSVLEATQVLWSAQTKLIAAKLDLGLAWVRLQRDGPPGRPAVTPRLPIETDGARRRGRVRGARRAARGSIRSFELAVRPPHLRAARSRRRAAARRARVACGHGDGRRNAARRATQPCRSTRNELAR